MLFPLCCFSQTPFDVYLDDDMTEEDVEELYERFSEAVEHPININNATECRPQLEALDLFTADQIDDILEYVIRYGPIRSKAELMMIQSLDINSRQLLSSVVVLGESDREKHTSDYYKALLGDSIKQTLYPVSPIWRNSGGTENLDLLAYIRIPLYEQTDADKYQGGRLKHWLRANYSASSHLRLGFVASQDAGEPFFKGKNKCGYDLYSAYLQLKNIRIGNSGAKLRNLVAGRFRIRSASGLILNTGNTFRSFGVSSFSAMPSSQVSITPGNSRSEQSTMQGIAATIDFSPHWEVSLFASYRPIDATLTYDEDSLTCISTILRNGYHRTESELARKHNAWQTSAGAIIGYHTNHLNLGLTTVYDHYSLPLHPYSEDSSLSQLYKRYYPKGQDFLNLSINYGYRLGKRLTFQGETATSSLFNTPLHFAFPQKPGAGGLSTINSLILRISTPFSLSLLQRFYPYRYQTTIGRSFSAGGSNQDESGIYLAANWNPSAHLSLMAYTDIAYFAWPKYQALGSSHSFDNQVQLCWKIDSRQRLNLRYRLRMRQRDADKDAAGYDDGDLIYKNEHRMRLNYQWSGVGSRTRWVLNTKLDLNHCSYRKSDSGMMLSQDATLRTKNLDVTASFGYFNTSDYNTRIYSYEPSTPYNLSFPSFYGEGFRTYLLADATLLDRAKGKLSLITKLELTQYLSDHTTARTQPALNLSLRWKY